MKKLILSAAGSASLLALAGTAQAAGFVNGDFESGTLGGWTIGGGEWDTGTYSPPSYPIASDYAPSGSKYNPSYIVTSVTNVGFDANTDNKLRTVYAGAHSAQVNDSNPGFGVSSISQTIKNYSDTHIAFAYAAVLQDSHGAFDSDAFNITLKDVTTNTILFTYNLNSFTAPGVFTESSTGWFYSDWLTQNIAVTQGHDFELTLLANDCAQGAHAGYAYLDGFGGVVPPPVTGAVPEPASWAMMISGFGLVGGAMRARRRKGSVTVSFA